MPSGRLLFTAIDQMAWLADEKETVGNEGFRACVQRYMLDTNPHLLSGASASDLWGARCGVLHTGAPESDWYRKNKARRIFYSSNIGQIEASKSDVLIISIEWLWMAFVAALVHFHRDLQADEAKDARACEIGPYARGSGTDGLALGQNGKLMSKAFQLLADLDYLEQIGMTVDQLRALHHWSGTPTET